MLWLGLPQEANSESGTSVQGIFRECFWDPTLVEGKGRKQNWAEWEVGPQYSFSGHLSGGSGEFRRWTEDGLTFQHFPN